MVKAKDLSALIGRKGYVRMSSSNSGDRVRVDVRILDGRTAFGREDLLVKPVAGDGEAWVSLDNVTLYSESVS